MSIFSQLRYRTPGIGDSWESIERELSWGSLDYNNYFKKDILLLGTSRDAGHAGSTTLLRPGLLLGRVTASGAYVPWASGASDGSEVIKGVLGIAIDATYISQDTDRYGGLLWYSGQIKARSVLIPGNPTWGIVGDAQEAAVRAGLKLDGKFLIDDEF